MLDVSLNSSVPPVTGISLVSRVNLRSVITASKTNPMSLLHLPILIFGLVKSPGSSSRIYAYASSAIKSLFAVIKLAASCALLSTDVLDNIGGLKN